MILGSIIGKTTTLDFKFLIKNDAKKFQYIQVMHKGRYYVLAQILEIEKEIEKSIARCIVIGHNDSGLKKLISPLDPGTEVLEADDSFIKETLQLSDDGAFIGVLNGKPQIKVNIDLNKLLTKHVVILAKTGSGKSYTNAVIIEELLDRKVPIIIIDPHREYCTLTQENEEEREKLMQYGLKPKSYEIEEYAVNVEENKNAKQLKLNLNNLAASELIHLLPAKLSNAQMALLYSALKNINKIDFDELIINLEIEDSNVKFIIINIIEYIKRLGLFSNTPTELKAMLKPGRATLINLQGIPDDIKEIVVYKLTKDLFEERKRNNIPPFFFVIEEAQNFIPERNFGETKCSSILRQVVAEGRKFGISVGVISQRPSRIDKNVIANASTQIILKVTNPNDVRAIVSSVEGITSETEKEIVNMPVGTAMITGLADMPLFVDIRPRKSMHGGKTILLVDESPDVELSDDSASELLCIIKPRHSAKDAALMKGSEVKTTLIPCIFLECRQNNNDFCLLININSNEFVSNVDSYKGTPVNMSEFKLSPLHTKIFNTALKLNEFKATDLFAKSGLMFSEVYDGVNSLVNKGIFLKIGDKYKLNEQLSLSNNIAGHSLYADARYENIKYDSKLDVMHEKNRIIDFLGKFLEVKNHKDCFLVRYE